MTVEKCIKCGEIHPFTEEYFTKDKHKKYGLRYVCNDCHKKYVMVQHYKHRYGIILDEYKLLNTYSIIEWYKLVLNSKLRSIPKELDTKENCKIIIKYVIENVIVPEKYCELSYEVFKDNKIRYMLKYWGSNLSHCISEIFNLSDFDIRCGKIVKQKKHKIKFSMEDDFVCEKLDEILVCFSIEEILQGKFTRKELMDNNLNTLSLKFGGVQKMFIHYFDIKNIKYKEQIITIDMFKNKHNGYYSEDKIIELIKIYCENKYETSIINVMHDKNLLLKWCNKYWNADNIDEISTVLLNKYSLYSLLILCYPQIYNDGILFAWEMKSCKWGNKDKRIKYLRELVLDRLKLHDFKSISVFLNPNILRSSTYSNFYSALSAYYKSYSFYNWAYESFPEYKNKWTEKDFGKVCIGIDGYSRLNSFKEKIVFDYIWNDLNIKNILAIGMKDNKKYKYYDKNNECSYYPDFVIESKYSKPIIIEYYGMIDYVDSKIRNAYRQKTYNKNKYYKMNNGIYFIDFYPSDLKSNCQGVKEKLTSFFMSNFNINISEVDENLNINNLIKAV